MTNLRAVTPHPGSWVMLTQRKTGTHHLAHVVDPHPGTYVGPGSVKTRCLKLGRVIAHLGSVDSELPVCPTCLKRAKR